MKKYVLLSLMLMCMPAFAAPSVHAVGSVAAPASVGSATKAKATPVRASSAKLSANTTSLSRIGSVRPSASKNSVTGAITAADYASRVPIIPVKTYSITSGNNSETSSSQGSNQQSSCCNVDVDAIIQAIRQEFYDKTEVYNNNHFTNAVTDIVNGMINEPAEDPRIDAVRIVNQANSKLPSEVWAEKSIVLPNDYVYVWIEE